VRMARNRSYGMLKEKGELLASNWDHGFVLCPSLISRLILIVKKDYFQQSTVFMMGTMYSEGNLLQTSPLLRFLMLLMIDWE
jgi:hypothetical protein